MGKVNLDNRVQHLIDLSAKHIFKNLNKPLHKSWLASFTVRGHDRVDKCKIQFKDGLVEFVYSPSWLKSLENSVGTFVADSAIDHLASIITAQDSKMKSKRGRKPKKKINYSYNLPKISI